MKLKPKFVQYMPSVIDEGILYISPEFRAVIHRCPCGCGNKIHTPLSPTDWKMTFNGKSVSLSPSVGSWNLECKSHYWIRKNKIVWAESWDDKRVEEERRFYKQKSDSYFNSEDDTKTKKESYWSRFLASFGF